MEVLWIIQLETVWWWRFHPYGITILFSQQSKEIKKEEMEKKKKGKKEWKSKKFNIFGDIWTIILCEKVMGTSSENSEEHWIWGQTIDAERKILVSTLDAENKPLKEHDILCTVAHECIHAILDSGQYLNATQDEPMVEFLAKGILSLIKSKVFEYETSFH